MHSAALSRRQRRSSSQRGGRGLRPRRHPADGAGPRRGAARGGAARRRLLPAAASAHLRGDDPPEGEGGARGRGRTHGGGGAAPGRRAREGGGRVLRQLAADGRPGAGRRAGLRPHRQGARAPAEHPGHNPPDPGRRPLAPRRCEGPDRASRVGPLQDRTRRRDVRDEDDRGRPPRRDRQAGGALPQRRRPHRNAERLPGHRRPDRRLPARKPDRVGCTPIHG